MAQLKYTAEIELNEEQIQEILAKALEVGKDDVKIRKIFDERTKTVQLAAIVKKTFEILLDKSTVQPMTVPYIPTDSSTSVSMNTSRSSDIKLSVWSASNLDQQ